MLARQLLQRFDLGAGKADRYATALIQWDGGPWPVARKLQRRRSVPELVSPPLRLVASGGAVPPFPPPRGKIPGGDRQIGQLRDTPLGTRRVELSELPNEYVERPPVPDHSVPYRVQNALVGAVRDEVRTEERRGSQVERNSLTTAEVFLENVVAVLVR